LCSFFFNSLGKNTFWPRVFGGWFIKQDALGFFIFGSATCAFWGGTFFFPKGFWRFVFLLCLLFAGVFKLEVWGVVGHGFFLKPVCV